MATKEAATHLLKRYLTGINTAAERHLVEHFFLEYLKKEETLPPAAELPRILSEIRQTVAERTGVSLQPSEPITLHRRSFPWLAAAAVVLVASIAYFFFLMPQPASRGGKGTAVQLTPVPEGHRRASLILPDGQEIPLRSTESTIFMDGCGMYYADGEEVYRENFSFHTHAVYTVRTPAGGQYDVVLPDGSRVRLNAESSLRTALHFRGRPRRVEIEGEGHFAITRRRMFFSAEPFSVSSRGQNVNVLGTEFSISAYPDEPEVKTTLYTGSVHVQAGQGESLLLEPGEQATLSGEGQLTKQVVDTKQDKTWQTGYIELSGKPFEQVMREIARWYGLELEYTGHIQHPGYSGKITTVTSLSKVLTLLQGEYVSFGLENGRTLIIKPGKNISPY